MLVYLLVVTLTGFAAGFGDVDGRLQPLITETVMTHSFALTYRDRVSADVALQRIHTRWADALQVTVTAAVYEVCVPVPEIWPCAGGRIWIRLAPPIGVGP
mgnify:CR=1 FL=1